MPIDKSVLKDRVPILVTAYGEEQLLGVPELNSSTGREQAESVVALCDKWGITCKVCGLVFDTTAHNSGHMSGAAVLIQELMGKELLCFACRHHILELVLGAAFVAAVGDSNSPTIPIFLRFKNAWTGFKKGSAYMIWVCRLRVAQKQKNSYNSSFDII